MTEIAPICCGIRNDPAPERFNRGWCHWLYVASVTVAREEKAGASPVIEICADLLR